MKTNQCDALLFRIGKWACALPLKDVRETMRPLPTEPLTNVPPYVLGVSIIRGKPTPVLNAAGLIGIEETTIFRFVLLDVANRQLALAVENVLGIRALSSSPEMIPLLQKASPDVIASIGTLHPELLIVLKTAQLVPESLWDALEGGRK